MAFASVLPVLGNNPANQLREPTKSSLRTAPPEPPVAQKRLRPRRRTGAHVVFAGSHALTHPPGSG